MTRKNAFYAQSGGVTAVINASACGVIQTARKHKKQIDYGHDGKLAFSEVTVDPSTGSYGIRVVVPNPENLLLPGMYVRAIVGKYPGHAGLASDHTNRHRRNLSSA